MPNHRGSDPGSLEQAHPWEAGRFADPEPQEARGAPGSRDRGEPARSRPGEQTKASDWTGVNPKDPIAESMPGIKPGDQGG